MKNLIFSTIKDLAPIGLMLSRPAAVLNHPAFLPRFSTFVVLYTVADLRKDDGKNDKKDGILTISTATFIRRIAGLSCCVQFCHWPEFDATEPERHQNEMKQRSHISLGPKKGRFYQNTF
jgi:hypothetical protein